MYQKRALAILSAAALLTFTAWQGGLGTAISAATAGAPAVTATAQAQAADIVAQAANAQAMKAAVRVVVTAIVVQQDAVDTVVAQIRWVAEQLAYPFVSYRREIVAIPPQSLSPS